MYFLSPLPRLFPSSPAQCLSKSIIFWSKVGCRCQGSLAFRLVFAWETTPVCPQIKSLAPSAQGMSPASPCSWHQRQLGDSPGCDTSRWYRTNKSKGRSIACGDAEPGPITPPQDIQMSWWQGWGATGLCAGWAGQWWDDAPVPALARLREGLGGCTILSAVMDTNTELAHGPKAPQTGQGSCSGAPLLSLLAPQTGHCPLCCHGSSWAGQSLPTVNRQHPPAGRSSFLWCSPWPHTHPLSTRAHQPLSLPHDKVTENNSKLEQSHSTFKKSPFSLRRGMHSVCTCSPNASMSGPYFGKPGHDFALSSCLNFSCFQLARLSRALRRGDLSHSHCSWICSILSIKSIYIRVH